MTLPVSVSIVVSFHQGRLVAGQSVLPRDQTYLQGEQLNEQLTMQFHSNKTQTDAVQKHYL